MSGLETWGDTHTNVFRETIQPTCNHDGADVGLRQLLNDGSGLWLQTVLHHQQAQKRQVTLHLFPVITFISSGHTPFVLCNYIHIQRSHSTCSLQLHSYPVVTLYLFSVIICTWNRHTPLLPFKYIHTQQSYSTCSLQLYLHEVVILQVLPVIICTNNCHT